jgi:phage terminase large subunit-like protein
MFGMRMGTHPRVCITTTPRPTKLLKALLKDPACVVTKGKTTDNLPNLSGLYKNIIKRYAGTRLGRQELDAEILDDNPGALWNYSLIERNRLRSIPEGVTLVRVGIGVDPEGSSEEGAAETGIVVAALGSDGHYYVMADVSERARPEIWGRAVVNAYTAMDADIIVPEKNNGGEMVEATIRAIRDDEDNPIGKQTNIKPVHASRGKITRAEPISALYEQNLVHHLGLFPELEDQMCDYDPNTAKVSPDRMDALVWILTELSSKGSVNLEEDTFIVSSMIARERYLQ